MRTHPAGDRHHQKHHYHQRFFNGDSEDNSNVLRITIKKMFDSDESSLTMIVTLFNSVCDDTREEIFWQEKIS